MHTAHFCGSAGEGWWDVVLGGLVPGKVWPVDRMTGAYEIITFLQSRKFLNFLRHANDVVSPVWALNACLHGATTIPIKFVFGRNYLYRVAHSSQISRRRMHSSRMLTARFLLYGGCFCPGAISVQGFCVQGVSLTETSPKEHGTRDRNPPRKNMGPDTESSPRRNMGPGSQIGSDIMQND